MKEKKGYREVRLFGGSKNLTTIHIARELSSIDMSMLINPQTMEHDKAETYTIHYLESGEIVGVYDGKHDLANQKSAIEKAVEGLPIFVPGVRSGDVNLNSYLSRVLVLRAITEATE